MPQGGRTLPWSASVQSVGEWPLPGVAHRFVCLGRDRQQDGFGSVLKERRPVLGLAFLHPVAVDLEGARVDELADGLDGVRVALDHLLGDGFGAAVVAVDAHRGQNSHANDLREESRWAQFIQTEGICSGRAPLGSDTLPGISFSPWTACRDWTLAPRPQHTGRRTSGWERPSLWIAAWGPPPTSERSAESKRGESLMHKSLYRIVTFPKGADQIFHGVGAVLPLWRREVVGSCQDHAQHQHLFPVPEGRRACKQRVHNDPWTPSAVGWRKLLFFFNRIHMSSCVVLVCAHSHVHRSPISFVSCIHGTFNNLWGEVTGGPAHLCDTDMSNFTEMEKKKTNLNPLGDRWLEEDVQPFSVWSVWICTEKPKSVSLMFISSSKRTFSGFRSRWTMPWMWRDSTTSIRARMIFLTPAHTTVITSQLHFPFHLELFRTGNELGRPGFLLTQSNSFSEVVEKFPSLHSGGEKAHLLVICCSIT